MTRSLIALFLGLFAACGSAQGAASPGAVEASKTNVARVLDDWHDAAAKADAPRYFGHLAAGAVFIGTDATERWDKAAFERFARPYFARGKAWTMKPTGRHVMIGGHGGIAWFDEQLVHAKYGPVRGSGVLVAEAGQWRIAHYVLSFPVPNAVSKQVIAVISGQPAPPAK